MIGTFHFYMTTGLISIKTCSKAFSIVYGIHIIQHLNVFFSYTRLWWKDIVLTHIPKVLGPIPLELLGSKLDFQNSLSVLGLHSLSDKTFNFESDGLKKGLTVSVFHSFLSFMDICVLYQTNKIPL